MTTANYWQRMRRRRVSRRALLRASDLPCAPLRHSRPPPSPLPPLHHPCPPSVIPCAPLPRPLQPPPKFLRRQESMLPPSQQPRRRTSRRPSDPSIACTPSSLQRNPPHFRSAVPLVPPRSPSPKGHPPSVIPCAPLRHPPRTPPSPLRPPPSFLRRQESMRSPSHQPRPHPPTALRSLNRRTPSSSQREPTDPHPLRPPPSSPPPPSVIPAQAGIHATTIPSTTPPDLPTALRPLNRRASLLVDSETLRPLIPRAPTVVPAPPSITPAPPRHPLRAPPPSFLRRQESMRPPSHQPRPKPSDGPPIPQSPAPPSTRAPRPSHLTTPPPLGLMSCNRLARTFSHAHPSPAPHPHPRSPSPPPTWSLSPQHRRATRCLARHHPRRPPVARIQLARHRGPHRAGRAT